MLSADCWIKQPPTVKELLAKFENIALCKSVQRFQPVYFGIVFSLDFEPTTLLHINTLFHYIVN